MKSLLVGPDVSNVHVKKLGHRVSSEEDCGICVDGRLLVIQKDKKGHIVGLEFV